jgi:cytochrome c-type biogenesis protein CcmH
VSGLLFWAIAAAMAGLAAIRLLWPLARPAAAPAAPAESYDIAVYRDQLAEIDRDLGRGLLTGEAAAAARLEIERRLLAAARELPAPADEEAAAAPGRRRPAIAAAVACGLPLLALGLYLGLGSPGVPALPFAERPTAEAGGAGQPGELAPLADRLAKRLQVQPNDPEGWVLLGQTWQQLGRPADAASAYHQAIVHGGTQPGLRSAYGEALTEAAGGQVTPAAAEAFAAALKEDPGDARARFYLASAEAQAGHPDRALEQLVALEAAAPADAPWRPMVGSAIDQLARQLGRDPATLPGRKVAAAPPPAAAAGAAPPLDPGTMAQVQAMKPEEREAFIKGMVAQLADRLKQQPGDLEGWLRLARAYGVLGQRPEQQDALAHAMALAPERSDIQLDYAGALLQGSGAGKPPPAFGETVAKVLAREPDNRLALYYAGLAAAAAGRPAEARQHWQKLLATIPAEAPQRAELQRQIDALGAP